MLRRARRRSPHPGRGLTRYPRPLTLRIIFLCAVMHPPHPPPRTLHLHLPPTTTRGTDPNETLERPGCDLPAHRDTRDADARRWPAPARAAGRLQGRLLRGRAGACGAPHAPVRDLHAQTRADALRAVEPGV